MRKVKHTELERLIEICYERKVALYVWGAVGIGKSDTIKQASKALAKKLKLEFSDIDIQDGKFGFVDVRISQLDPSDLRGLPTFHDGQTKWLPPSWLPSNPKGKGIIFFDELNLAPPSIQAAAYQLILDRRIGDYKLPEGWVIVAAGNRAEDNPKVFELPAPLLNRFIHAELQVPGVEDWTNWALLNGIDSRIISFLNVRPSMLFKFDLRNKDKSFPTPRSWEFVSKLIKDETDDELIGMCVASAVGEGCAAEFEGFCKLSRKIDIDKIFKNPASVSEIKEIDLKYNLTSIVAEKYKQDKKLLPKVFAICEHLDPEFAVLQIRYARAANPEKWLSDVQKEPRWTDFMKKYGKYL